VKHTLDVAMPLSADEQAMLARLAVMPDSDIDYSDIPPSSPGTKWTRPGGPPSVTAPPRKRRD
jgi:hypothetical protein